MSTYRKLLIPLACLLLCVPIVPAQATSEGFTYERAKKMDVDQDGAITLAEFLSSSSDLPLFKKIDVDGNAILDADEIRKAVRPPYKIHN